MSEIQKTNNNTETDSKNEAADFEKAIDAAGFGMFNLILLFVSIPASFAAVFESSSMSYILPIAECDLKLTMLNKGVLNAATYAGMIVSAIIWGYLADTLGRRKILIFGYLADALCVFCSSLAQNFQMLVAFKFLGGFIVNGPGAVIFTYLTELHGAKHRPRVTMALGMMASTATLVLPLLAWATFPRDWDFFIFNHLKVHSWQIFLALCGLPSLISGICIIALPESPKFLMSQGRNAEALRSFQKIYAFNKRVPKETYPIKELVEEVPNRTRNVNIVTITIDNKASKPKFKREPRTFLQALKEGSQQIKPMFRKPLLGHSIQVYTMQFCILLGLNTIRLWLPQLFASIAEYEALNIAPEESANLCTILEFSVNKTVSAAANYQNHCSKGKIMLAAALIALANGERNMLRVHRRHLRDATDPFHLPEERFEELFRCKKEAAIALLTEISPFMKNGQRPTFVPKALRMSAALHYYATGSFLRDVGQDFVCSLSKTILCRSVKEVTYIIEEKLMCKYIKFPTTTTINSNGLPHITA